MTSTSQDREDGIGGLLHLWEDITFGPGYGPPHFPLSGIGLITITRIYDRNQGWCEKLKVTDTGMKWSKKGYLIEPVLGTYNQC